MQIINTHLTTELKLDNMNQGEATTVTGIGIREFCSTGSPELRFHRHIHIHIVALAQAP